MNIGNLFIYIFISTAVVSVLVMMFTRTIFYAALALIVCLLCVAGVYALLFAEFIAITQVIIYVGGVLVLILFGIMLTNRIAGKPLHAESHHVIKSALISLSIFLLIAVAYQKTSFAPLVTSPTHGNAINQIGIELMSTYVAPFEIAGVLLLVCLIGAAVMASSINKKDHV